MTQALRDQFGRSIEYLRISVTDRCNFRCLYCMPAEGLQWLPKAEILSYEEIAETVRQLAPLGLRRLRITGGEPTIRPDLPELVAQLKAVPGIEDIALSTNGVRLEALAPQLRAAGLDRVNISADSLRADRIAAISRRNLGFDPVRAAAAAEAQALNPVKINVVVMRGVNDDEIEDFARLTFDHPWHVRFIELMPVGEMRELTWDHVVPSDELLARVRAIGALTPSRGPARGNGPAAYYALEGAPGIDRGDHADDAHLLRILQPRAPHRRWAPAHLLVRRPRGGPAHAASRRASRWSRTSVARWRRSPRNTRCCR